MQSYNDQRGYFENTPADSIINRKKFRSGLSIHDRLRLLQARRDARDRLSRDARLRHQPPLVPGGRYAYVSAHFDSFTDHILCIVRLNKITKPVIVSK